MKLQKIRCRLGGNPLKVLLWGEWFLRIWVTHMSFRYLFYSYKSSKIRGSQIEPSKVLISWR